VKNPNEVYSALNRKRPGDTVTLTILREGEQQKVDVKVVGSAE
jgi:S1-C subfamily serine protease